MATKDQLIASAQRNLEKGQINKAIKDYQELLKLEPKGDQHKQKLADLLCRVNLKVEALSLYDSLAKGYAERGFFTKAIAVYKQMQRIDPANPDVYLRLAELNHNLGLIGNAMAEYRSLLELYENRNMVADAAGVLQRMVELEPENINLQLRVLQCLLKEKLYDKAKETILKACEVCGKSGDTVKSQKILQTILSHLPENNEFHTELANKLSEGTLFVDAIFVFNSLLKRSPQDQTVLNELATLYGKIDDAENEILILDQLLAVQPTVAAAERLVRLCIATGDHVRTLRKLAEHEALLDDGSHTLLIELYQELEIQLPGDQRVRSAIVRFFGGPSPTPVTDEVLSPSLGDLSLGDISGDFSFSDDEFQLHELLSPLPRSSEAGVLPQEKPLREEELVAEENVEEENVDVSIELPDEELSFEDIDTFEETAELTLPQEIIQDDAAPSLIDIDFDFSESAEAEFEFESDRAAGDELEVELAAEDRSEQVEISDTSDMDKIAATLDIDLLPQEEPQSPEVTVVSLAEGTDAAAEDDDEILELEPLEDEDDLGAELAALEELLHTEMEDAPPEEYLDLNIALDDVASDAPRTDEDFFDLAAELLDDGALQATEGLANVGEIDRFRFDSIFSEFKKGVDAQIDHEDSEAHYDLGIAYKEMGLMDDAIEEFKKSMRNPKRLADSLILIGICHAEKGAFADAEAIFSTAIARSEVQEADKVGTQYELGLVYEVWGRPADALRTFEAVAHSDPSFRNVGEKIETLRLLVAAGQSETVGDTPGSVSPGKNRVSFV